MPPAVRLSNANLNMLMLEIRLALRSSAWQNRGRTECNCGGGALYRCLECLTPNLCQECVIGAHIALPFHDLLEWQEGRQHFRRACLRDLGLRIALGHGGATCPNKRGGRLEALAPTGLHTVSVDFCACPDAWSEDDQIKAHGWWPLGSNFCSALDRHTLEALVADPSGASDDDGSDNERRQRRNPLVVNEHGRVVLPGAGFENPFVVNARGRIVAPGEDLMPTLPTQRVGDAGTQPRNTQNGSAGRIATRDVISVDTDTEEEGSPPPQGRRGRRARARDRGKRERAAVHQRRRVADARVAAAVNAEPGVVAVPAAPMGAVAAADAALPAVAAARNAPVHENAPAPLVVIHGGQIHLGPAFIQRIWLTAARPREVVAVDKNHECVVCTGVRAHPVTCSCGHSHCYSCLRLWFDKDLSCPECRAKISKKPIRQWFEERALRAIYGDWLNGSAVSYSWEGLPFPEEEEESA
ncbi:hypothetical protein C8R43DRAFT_1123651 [Mycena crocata]|nr:hypothetical protein C8R43DRAFT_1123651 [Mycena crocata]